MICFVSQSVHSVADKHWKKLFILPAARRLRLSLAACTQLRGVVGDFTSHVLVCRSINISENYLNKAAGKNNRV